MRFRIKEARIMKGLSLREAAHGLGKSHEWLRKFERGDYEMDSTKLIMFANLYGVTTDYLVDRPDRIKVELSNIRFCKMPKYV